MDACHYHPIGVIRTPFKTIQDMPIQNLGAKGIRGSVELLPEFSEGLKDIDGFSHLILIYHFHKVIHKELVVKPFMDTVSHGIFATRSPVRPNPIGMTVVKLIERNGNLLIIQDLDMLDETPLLDIKPCLPMIDDLQNVRLGWMTGKIEKFEAVRSDDRFVK